MEFNDIVATIITLLMIPLQWLFVPIDALMAQIPGIAIIPSSLRQLGGFVRQLPQTLLSLTGLSPIIWNAFFTIFLLYIMLSPAINLVKKIWAWIRP